MTNSADPVRSLVEQWREVAEYFTGSTGLDIRETLIDCADDLEAALSQQQSSAEDEVEYEYEVWQDGVLQAGGRENDYASAKSEANHYAMMYAQDGPVEVRIYEKRLLSVTKQPAVDEGMVERIAALLYEEATGDPWTVSSITHTGPDRDYYRGLARKVAAIAAQQPAEGGERDWLEEAIFDALFGGKEGT